MCGVGEECSTNWWLPVFLCGLGVACTLANGSDGQVKTFLNVSTGGTNAVTITPASLRGYTNIILNAPGETVTCIFKNSNWNIIAGNGYTTS